MYFECNIYEANSYLDNATAMSYAIVKSGGGVVQNGALYTKNPHNVHIVNTFIWVAITSRYDSSIQIQLFDNHTA